MSFQDALRSRRMLKDEPTMQSAMPQTAQPGGSEPKPAEGKPSGGWSLPDLDPADPDYAEKKSIHDAFVALDEHFSKGPQIDYEGHYRKIAEEMKKAPQERRKNPLSLFAIAMGTQDPNDPYAPNRGLAIEKESAEKTHAQELSEFEKTLSLKNEAFSGQIRQHLAQGEFKRALALAEAKARNDITMKRLEDERGHKNKMDEIEAQGKAKIEAARVSAQAAMARVERRLSAAKERGQDLKLSPTDRAQMNAEIDRAMVRFRQMTARDAMTGEAPDPDVIEDAEETHRRELARIHDHYEDRELGDRPEPANPPAKKTSSRPSGAAWEAAAKDQ